MTSRTWTKPNVEDTLDIFQIRRLKQQKAAASAARAAGKVSSASTDNLPLNFTVSDKWPECKSVFETIQDQSACGSCWAVSTASVLSDRRCILYKKPMPAISAWDLASCCRKCTGGSTNGCDGGFPAKAFRYFFKTGVVTGGGYGSELGCKPYKVSPNETIEVISKCQKKCRKGYKKSPKKAYKKDKKYGKKKVKIYSMDTAAVMNEIYNYGPVVASYKMFKDFYKYKGGIYKQYSNVQDGEHAVRVVGWGVTSNGTKYWYVDF
ncbi:Papain family cysteine protease [Aphelenchoides bicaudatus]|nr:Papain family cysteine protease [Aphelenchoides bicaudatus]